MLINTKKINWKILKSNEESNELRQWVNKELERDISYDEKILLKQKPKITTIV